jgi:hypothetical protein
MMANEGVTMDIKFSGPQKRPMRIGTVQTVDLQTGEVIAEQPNAMTILSPRSGCPECGTEHQHDQPHNQQSLVYQYRFCATHGRWPTWADAMAHCSDEVKVIWRQHLIEVMRARGMKIPDDLMGPNPAAR